MVPFVLLAFICIAFIVLYLYHNLMKHISTQNEALSALVQSNEKLHKEHKDLLDILEVIIETQKTFTQILKEKVH